VGRCLDRAPGHSIRHAISGTLCRAVVLMVGRLLGRSRRCGEQRQAGDQGQEAQATRTTLSGRSDLSIPHEGLSDWWVRGSGGMGPNGIFPEIQPPRTLCWSRKNGVRIHPSKREWSLLEAQKGRGLR
jgi:hypothetical protein